MKPFRIDSPFWKFFDFLGEIVVVNLLFILTSIPIFTIGAGITAMNAVFFRRSERRLDSPAREYFKAFKENFMRSTIIWGMYLVFAGAILLNVYTNSVYLPLDQKVVYILLGILGMIMTITLMFALAMTARFQNTFSDTLIKALEIGILNAPLAIAIILMCAATVLATFSSVLTFVILLSVWLTLGFGLIGYLSSLMFLRAFRRFTAKEDLIDDSQTEEMYRAMEADREARQRKAARRLNK